MLYYTGVGSQKTPLSVRQQMIEIAQLMAKCGYILRSGAADGADTAFETGCDLVGGEKEIYLPWSGFNKHPSTFAPARPQALEMAAKFHPAWHHCSYGVKKLHARNCHQVLGWDLKTPSELVICWTIPNKGGTSQAVRIAMAHDIPVVNLYTDPEWNAAIWLSAQFTEGIRNQQLIDEFYTSELPERLPNEDPDYD